MKANEPSLTSDQKDSFNHFLDWMKEGSDLKPFILSGFAGSGKTFLSMKFLRFAEEQKLVWTVVAPTHKAVGVLRRALLKEGLRTTWFPSTIHRLLRLKIKRKGALEVCEATDQTNNSLENLQLVLVDEASMVDSHLLEIVLQCAHAFKTRLVFVGDPAQLPPIGEIKSPVFSMMNSFKSHLNKVVRHQGPVLKLANLLRDENFPCSSPPCFKPFEDDKGLICSLDKNLWLEKAKESLSLSSEQGDPDSARILCYTNKFIERLVPHARRAIHGDMADQMSVLPGETLISRKAVMSLASVEVSHSEEEPGILIGSNVEMEVKDVSYESFTFSDLSLSQYHELEEFKIDTLIAKVQIGLKEFCIRLIPEVGTYSRQLLDSTLKELSFKAKEISSTKKTRVFWRDFFCLRDSFASLGPASVLTVHRSQGSTFGEVFIAHDIFWPKDISLRRQLAYVAVSRASRRVWLLGNDRKGFFDSSWEKELDAFHVSFRN